MQPTPVHFAASGRGQVAYQIVGDAATTVVVVPPLAQNIEKMWEQPAFWRPIRRLAGAVRFVHYDKLGTGLSDPVPAASSLEERVAELTAVASDAGIDHAWLLGLSEGGMVAAAAAALLPSLVDGLVLVNTSSGAGALTGAAAHGPVRSLEETLSFFGSVADRWATPESLVLPVFAPSLRAVSGMARWMAAYERAAASPALIHQLVASGLRLDCTSLLSDIAKPTLVVHHRGDGVLPVAHGRFLAASIPGAAYREIDGNDHYAWVAPSVDAVLDEILAFIGVAGDDTSRSDRLLDPWSSLTPAEARVARLVQRGLTNAEIAASLSVSTRTVESQLSRCYAKLHVRSRTELAILRES